jgi:hypothetical protein
MFADDDAETSSEIQSELEEKHAIPQQKALETEQPSQPNLSEQLQGKI